MPNNLSKFKNLIIGFLALLAVYQTSELWFKDSLRHNFFYSFLSANSGKSSKTNYDSFAYPYRIITNLGNHKFDISYSGISESPTRQTADAAIALVLKNGNFAGSSAIDWQSILSNRSLIYEFAFEMPSAHYVKIFSQKSNLLTARVIKFNSIVITPDAEASELLRVYFINNAEDICVEINTSSIEMCDSIRSEIQAVQKRAEEKEIYYVSSEQLKLGTDTNLYLPRWSGEGLSYKTGVIGVNYYTDLTKAAISTKVDSFFDNPAAKVDVISDIITFSDENTVLRYYENDILEYTNYKTNAAVKSSTLLDDYSAAINFIKTKDEYMTNDYYLAGYSEDPKNGTRYFYFDFVVNDFPLIYLETTKKSMSPTINHGIEISFEQGNIRKYTKLAYDFKANEEKTEIATEDFMKYMENQSIGGDDIAGINFGYGVGMRDRIKGDKDMLLWFDLITTDGIFMTKSASQLN